MKFNPLAFIINIAIPLAAGVLGSLFTIQSVNTWYKTVNKPSFNPPDSIFQPVWIAIFVLIGIASYRIWQRRNHIASFPRTVAIYAMQLILNIMWSFIFFRTHDIGLALFEIIIFLIIIVINARVFYKIDKTAGLLFIPYILWVSFATILNYNIFILN